jgi:hypothetical protein
MDTYNQFDDIKKNKKKMDLLQYIQQQYIQQYGRMVHYIMMKIERCIKTIFR